MLKEFFDDFSWHWCGLVAALGLGCFGINLAMIHGLQKWIEADTRVCAVDGPYQKDHDGLILNLKCPDGKTATVGSSLLVDYLNNSGKQFVCTRSISTITTAEDESCEVK